MKHSLRLTLWCILGTTLLTGSWNAPVKVDITGSSILLMVGSGTVLMDDPELTCRLPGLEDRSPVRVVVASICASYSSAERS